MSDNLGTVDPLALSEALHLLGSSQVIPPGPINLPAAAKWYALKWSWPVFPLRPRGKTPLTERGFHDATTDLEQITAWAAKWPDANWGTPTGPDGCGFDVVDVDGVAGYASLAEIQAELPPVRAVAFTPGDPVKDRAPGRHLYIDAQNQQNATALLPGLDVRATGGYVVIPPSIALHGVNYAWLIKPAGKP